MLLRWTRGPYGQGGSDMSAGGRALRQPAGGTHGSAGAVWSNGTSPDIGISCVVTEPPVRDHPSPARRFLSSSDIAFVPGHAQPEGASSGRASSGQGTSSRRGEVCSALPTYADGWSALNDSGDGDGDLDGGLVVSLA